MAACSTLWPKSGLSYERSVAPVAACSTLWPKSGLSYERSVAPLASARFGALPKPTPTSVFQLTGHRVARTWCQQGARLGYGRLGLNPWRLLSRGSLAGGRVNKGPCRDVRPTRAYLGGRGTRGPCKEESSLMSGIIRGLFRAARGLTRHFLDGRLLCGCSPDLLSSGNGAVDE